MAYDFEIIRRNRKGKQINLGLYTERKELCSGLPLDRTFQNLTQAIMYCSLNEVLSASAEPLTIEYSIIVASLQRYSHAGQIYQIEVILLIRIDTEIAIF